MHTKYETDRMKNIWSEEHKFEVWWQIEEAALAGWMEVGAVSEDRFREIVRKVEWSTGRIKEIEAEIRHDMLAFLENIEENLGELSGDVHRGLTSSDVKDTATSIRARESLEVLEGDVQKLIDLLKNMARKHKETLMIGRTHGVHAEPVTFGLKCLIWLEEFRRQLKRLRAAGEEINVGKLSGAVGTYAEIPPAVEKTACRRLGIEPSPVSSQIVQRDRHARVISTLANLAGTIEKIAVEIRNLQRTEILEVQENFEEKQKGSSAMPHKKNPILSERLTGQARCLRGYAQGAFETQSLWHERDLSNSSTERIVFPDAFNLVHYMVKNCHRLLEGLGVFEEKMLSNIELTRGVIYSQRVMLKLAEKGWERSRAYEKVQALAGDSWDNETDFKEMVNNDEQISSTLTEAELEELFDPAEFLEHIDEIYDRVLEE